MAAPKHFSFSDCTMLCCAGRGCGQPALTAGSSPSTHPNQGHKPCSWWWNQDLTTDLVFLGRWRDQHCTSLQVILVPLQPGYSL